MQVSAKEEGKFVDDLTANMFVLSAFRIRMGYCKGFSVRLGVSS